ncbi:hypothetical protein CFOL_v3_09209, partial [Cephalotus follicularis]
TKTTLRRTRRRRRRRARVSRGRILSHHARACRARRSNVDGGSTWSKLSNKLQALKNLIPASNGEMVKADQLFQQTADYIVLLRTQVAILRRLIEFYGSCETNNN